MTEPGNEKTYALFDTPNNKKLIADLEAVGTKIFKISLIEARNREFDESLRIKLKNPKQFDWIIFTDVLTVDFYLNILEENGIDLFELDDVRICAFGEAVSDRLRFVQIHTDVLPTKIDDSTIFDAIKNYVNCETGLNGQHILILQSKYMPVTLSVRLTDAGAKVEEAAIYDFENLRSEEFSKVSALIVGGAIDDFIFSTPEDIILLKFLLSTGNLNDNLFEQFTVTNETMYKCVSELGIKPRYFSN